MKPKILLVEDDPSLTQIYKIELEMDGFEVLDSADGEDGFEKVKSAKPALVLLDIVLPKLNGLAVLEKIRKEGEIKNIPVIIITNFGQEENIKKAFSLGAEDVVLKYQTTPQEVVKKIRDILGRKGEK